MDPGSVILYRDADGTRRVAGLDEAVAFPGGVPAWGRGGDGARTLARAILATRLPAGEVDRYASAFARQIVTSVPYVGAVLTPRQIDDWVAVRRRIVTNPWFWAVVGVIALVALGAFPIRESGAWVERVCLILLVQVWVLFFLRALRVPSPRSDSHFDFFSELPPELRHSSEGDTAKGHA